jgi:O-6-methylguanine DNA methyltransferase
MSLATSWGDVSVVFAAGNVSACELPLCKRSDGPLRAGRADLRKVAPADRAVAHQSEVFLRALLAGEDAARPPVALPPGTPLQQAVWTALLAIPRGRVETYGSLARRLGRPRAARAIGQACGANPVPLFIPCHRVVAANGALGGFSSGLAWKDFLLDVEAVTMPGASVS